MAKSKASSQGAYTAAEAKRRRDEALRAALGMPPTVNKTPGVQRVKKARKTAKK